MTARKAIEDLFDLIFGEKDLRRFLETEVGCRETESQDAGIHWGDLDLRDRTSGFVEALELRGWVDQDLFQRLLEAFPERLPVITETARRCFPDFSPSSPPSAGRASSASMAEPEPKGGSWDIFLAHAGPDGADADELYEILSLEGLSVFLDSRCMGLGERWDEAIPAALRRARMVVVLLSQRTRDAYYAREEILLAIDQSRLPGSSTRVVPVYLDAMPENPADWLYGLRRLNGMVAADAGWPAGVAERIVEHVEQAWEPGWEPDRPPPVEEAADSPAGQEGPEADQAAPAAAPLPTTLMQYLHPALDLDRSAQWHDLVTESRSARSAVFLLYGERRQNLKMFVARLCHYLAEETGLHHRVVFVPARWEAELPRSGAAWEIHLRKAFPSGEGTAADLLAEAARHQPVFLILGEEPLSRDLLEEDEEAIAALEEFLEDRLTGLLSRCSGVHPVRALLAIDHEPPEESLEPRLDAKIQRGARRHEVRYRRLPEVEHVRWSHVKGYLDGLEPRPSASVYRVLEREYQRLDHDRISFRDLAERLSRRF